MNTHTHSWTHKLHHVNNTIKRKQIGLIILLQAYSYIHHTHTKKWQRTTISATLSPFQAWRTILSICLLKVVFIKGELFQYVCVTAASHVLCTSWHHSKKSANWIICFDYPGHSIPQLTNTFPSPIPFTRRQSLPDVEIWKRSTLQWSIKSFFTNWFVAGVMTYAYPVLVLPARVRTRSLRQYCWRVQRWLLFSTTRYDVFHFLWPTVCTKCYF